MALFALTAAADTTAFTYQGHLTDGGVPANGTYDLLFALYNSTSLIAGPVAESGVIVSNGLFTAQTDFGSAVFDDGGARWLEISVRTNGGSVYTILADRQPITATPYAIHAITMPATNLGGTLAFSQLPTGLLTNLPANVDLLNSNQTFTGMKTFTNKTFFSGFVGMGSGSPDRPLTIQGFGPGGEWISLKDTNGVTRWHLNDSFGGLNFNQTGVANFVLFLSTNGNVGIGTANPLSRLDVSGNVHLTGNLQVDNSAQVGGNMQVSGSVQVGGTNYAASSTEKLRIVRGTISDNGTSVTIFAGSGFTVSHPGPGAYTISFNTPFLSVPSFTATGVNSIARADTVNSITTSSVKVSLINTAGTSVNDSFSFIAIGTVN